MMMMVVVVAIKRERWAAVARINDNFGFDNFLERVHDLVRSRYCLLKYTILKRECIVVLDNSMVVLMLVVVGPNARAATVVTVVAVSIGAMD